MIGCYVVSKHKNKIKVGTLCRFGRRSRSWMLSQAPSSTFPHFFLSSPLVTVIKKKSQKENDIWLSVAQVLGLSTENKVVVGWVYTRLLVPCVTSKANQKTYSSPHFPVA